MDQHNIVYDGGKELERFPDFQQAVEDIIGSDRASVGPNEAELGKEIS